MSFSAMIFLKNGTALDTIDCLLDSLSILAFLVPFYHVGFSSPLFLDSHICGALAGSRASAITLVWGAVPSWKRTSSTCDYLHSKTYASPWQRITLKISIPFIIFHLPLKSFLHFHIFWTEKWSTVFPPSPLHFFISTHAACYWKCLFPNSAHLKTTQSSLTCDAGNNLS